MNENRRIAWAVLATAVVTAVAVGALFLFVLPAAEENDVTEPSPDIEQLESRIAELEAENAELQTLVEGAQAENAELQAALSELEEERARIARREIDHAPAEGWEEYFPEPESTTLEGESVEDVLELLGEPPFMIRSIAALPNANREVWVYVPFEDDPTGLYLFFKGNRLESSRLDEFPGLYLSGLLDAEWESFWIE